MQKAMKRRSNLHIRRDQLLSIRGLTLADEAAVLKALLVATSLSLFPNCCQVPLKTAQREALVVEGASYEGQVEVFYDDDAVDQGEHGRAVQ